MSNVEQPILDYISGVVAESGGTPVTRETQLLEAGVLDSINLVRLVQFLEDRFGISIPEGDMGAELFESPATVTAYVERRVTA
ncbi:MAG TPA: acyl carrier protein [Devosia sp.]|jgi:acyl carrier protein|nr:acyl carrier protein [Devosia sp.]